MRRAKRELVKLLFGPYTPQSLKRGDRATCLYRDCEVVITSWSHAPISWPRCQRPRQSGGSGLLVDEEAGSSNPIESSVALQYWFGVTAETVWRWRKVFGIGPWDTKGSRRLLQKSSEAGAAKTKRRHFPAEEREHHRQISLEHNLGQYLKPGYHGRWWTDEELALLGKRPDKDVARRIGRTVNAVRQMRTGRGNSVGQ
jgi:hypothetical protein